VKRTTTDLPRSVVLGGAEGAAPTKATTAMLEELSGGAKFVIVAGKGGVGKTTVAASLARMAANTGARVLVVDTEGKRGIASAFGVASLGYAEVTLSAASPAQGRGQILGRTVTPDDALIEWLGDHGLGLLAKRMSSSGLVDVIATATPGIRDLLVLAKVKQLVLEGGFDLVIMDTPASGHALTFLTSPKGLIEAVRSGPIRNQSNDVMALLTNAALTRVILVTLAEETPMAELTETAYALEDRVGVALGPVVINGLLPLVPAPPWPGFPAEPLQFEHERCTAQQSQVAALWDRLPLPQVHLPLLACAAIGPSELALLAEELHLVATATPNSVTTAGTRPSSKKLLSVDGGRSDRVASLDRVATRGEVQAANAMGTAAPQVGAQSGKAAAEPGIGVALADRTVVLCCGPGGVGKTTTAAALGLGFARQGKRVAVVTIDPAKRLADALGLADGLQNYPTQVDLSALEHKSTPKGAGDSGGDDSGGELWALMLDTKATFDGLVRRYSPNPAQAEKILANPFYRNISAAMGGTQEYMATEKLHELVTAPIDVDGLPMRAFDVVIVDTPPSRHALDFVAAPERLTRLLDNRVFRTLMAPAKRGFRVMGLATEGVLRGVGKIIGGEVLADAVAFFQAFEGMETGFRQRAVAIAALLRADSTAWVLVSAPTPEAVEEGLLLKHALANSSIGLAAIIANRVQPDLSGKQFPPPAADQNYLANHAIPASPIKHVLDTAHRRSQLHRQALAPLLSMDMAVGVSSTTKASRLKPSDPKAIPHILIPQRSTDVHNLAALAEIADLLLP
jgi:anion-transporting  ArsA/GET3 family ATPase